MVTINQLVDIVEDIAGLKLKRHYNLKAPKGVNGRNSDNTLIRSVFNWEPATRLRDGLERTYRWIHDDMGAVRRSFGQVSLRRRLRPDIGREEPNNGKRMGTIDVVLPVHNEAECIGATLREFYQVVSFESGIPVRFVVCEDGSRDNTVEVLQELSGELPILLLSENPQRLLPRRCRWLKGQHK